jgi:hypothetical protein
VQPLAISSWPLALFGRSRLIGRVERLFMNLTDFNKTSSKSQELMANNKELFAA